MQVVRDDLSTGASAPRAVVASTGPVATCARVASGLNAAQWFVVTSVWGRRSRLLSLRVRGLCPPVL